MVVYDFSRPRSLDPPRRVRRRSAAEVGAIAHTEPLSEPVSDPEPDPQVIVPDPIRISAPAEPGRPPSSRRRRTVVPTGTTPDGL
jgi:hypothetical protein